jgi:hypothetical protein
MKLSIEIDNLLTCATDIQAKAGDQVVVYQGAVLCVYKAPLILEDAAVKRKDIVTCTETVLSTHDLTESRRRAILAAIAEYPGRALRMLRNLAPKAFPMGCKGWMMCMRHEQLLEVQAGDGPAQRGTRYFITDKGRAYLGGAAQP